MPDETNIQRIIDYVRQYLEQYGPQELRQQLLAAGYLPDDIDAAFARLAPPATNAVVAQSEDEVQRMLAYLRQHRDHYSLDALRKQLVAAGQPPAVIEQAIAQLQAEQPLPSQPQAQPKRRLLTLVLALLNTFLLPAIAYLLALVFSSSADVLSNALVIASVLLLAELVTGLVLLFRGPTAWLGRSLLLSVAISVVLSIILIVIGLILLAGTCLVMLRNL